MTKSILDRKLWTIALAGLLITSCGKKEKDEDKEEAEEMARVLANGNSATSTNSPSVPQVGAVNLSGLGKDSAALFLDETSDRCDGGPDLGIFGLAIGGACHTSSFAAKIMVGSESGDNNGDGTLNCGDFTEGKDSGIILGLMCGDFFKRFDGIKSFSFVDGEKKEALGLSFADILLPISLSSGKLDERQFCKLSRKYSTLGWHSIARHNGRYICC